MRDGRSSGRDGEMSRCGKRRMKTEQTISNKWESLIRGIDIMVN